MFDFAKLTRRKPKGPPKTIFRFYVIRHGETRENRLGIIQGQLDTKLNDTGRHQAHLVGQAVKHIEFHQAYTSDLERARKTAEAIVAYHPSLQLNVDSGLRERYMAEWEGKRPESGKTRKADSPDVETSQAFTARVLKYWQELVAQCISTYGSEAGAINILMVGHGAYIGCLIRALLAHEGMKVGTGIDIQYTRCHNTSITVIEIRMLDEGQKKTTLRQFANIAHLSNFLPRIPRNPDVRR